jgi:acyl carrier protein
MHGAWIDLAPESFAESSLLENENPTAVGFADLMDNISISAGHRVVAMVQRLIRERSITRPVSSHDTLAEAGLTSLDAVRLVLLVEDEFNIEIPVSELTMANFRSISTISLLVSRLLGRLDA